jgi:hypothetical protein
MLKPPKVPWPYRVGALTLALVAGLCTLQFYVAGAKFAGAVTNYARLAAEMANEPGIVPVMIIPKKETK